ncbi:MULTISPECIES: hypothetical protein [unclassified Pseudomonas]|uniref:hypothetical protein n=1 Tax=unclassified Pseudomonas TaxID=196821 RepID=UPI00209750F9|nr:MULTISPECIES: hypothetical protein [unclassified Pseudomonas]MCO7503182.1 hypothetical protein [Pseudomonas sp. VE 267-6A]MCO7532460.1 hypothetical protein [Pseudomonas sp. 2]
MSDMKGIIEKSVGEHNDLLKTLMTDRELLELAAKAAGYRVEEHQPTGGFIAKQGFLQWRAWDPLFDDGDALRLAVQLCMNIEVTESDVYACSHGNFSEPAKPDRQAATRRAIVRAAAEVGKSMP